MGEFKVEVIFFPRWAPRGDPQGGGPQGGVPGGVPGSCSGFPSGEKNIRTPGVFFHAAFDVDTSGP